MNSGHHSVLEHVSFTFAIEDVSRSLLAQLTRHRIASYSVRSQRYVDMSNIEFITPNDIREDDASRVVFNETMNNVMVAYDSITKNLERKYISNGMKPNDAHKKAIENARSVLPNACPTQLMVTMNARALLNFFDLRCCKRAQEEICELANTMLDLVRDVSPVLFDTAGAGCVRGACPEGKMCCGNPYPKRG